MRWIVRTGSPWRYTPVDLPPWHTVYQQIHRWFKAGIFEFVVADLRALMRIVEGKSGDPTAVTFERRTLQGSVEDGDTGEYDGHKKREGRKPLLGVDTRGEFLALVVTPANEQERAQVAAFAEQVQAATGERVEVAFVDQGYTGREPELAAAGWGHPSGSGTVARGTYEVCAVAASVGDGAQLCVADAVLASGQGL